MKSSWRRSPDGGSSVARNTKIEPCGAVFCAWWGTGSTPIRSFHTVSPRTPVNKGRRRWAEAARDIRPSQRGLFSTAAEEAEKRTGEAEKTTVGAERRTGE